MKIFLKRSMALLLTVLMLLSCAVIGTLMFTVSAEEDSETEEAAYEAAIFKTEDGTLVPFEVDGVAQTGTFAGMLSVANEQADQKLVIKLCKDITLNEVINIKANAIGTIDGQGHTIYMSKALIEAARSTANNANFFIGFSDVGTDTFEITLENLNLNGQPKDWNGTAANATYFGPESGTPQGGAILLPKNAKLTMDNCRMENFYSYNRASCIYIIGPNNESDQAVTLNQRGVWLNDTVLTNNHSLGATAGSTAAAIRGHYGGIGAEVHVSGSTYIDNNYDKDGNPSANVFVYQGLDGNKHNSSATLYVASDFTGSVATTTDSVAPRTNNGWSEETHTEEDKTIRGAVIFEGAYDPTDGGFVYGWRGSTLRSLFVPQDPTKTSDVTVIKQENSNVFVYRDGEWSHSANSKEAFISVNDTVNGITATTVEQRLAEAKKTLVVLTGDQMNSYNGNENSGLYTVYGNGHVLTSEFNSSWGGLPMFRYSSANTTVIFNDIIIDGDIKTTVGTDGYLEFDRISTSDVEINAIGAGSGAGGALGSKDAGQYFALNNVEIRNFVQNRCDWDVGTDVRSGVAIYDAMGSEWHLNNVSIHDNYTGEFSTAVYMETSNTRVYLSGKIEMYNNHATEFDKKGNSASKETREESVVDNFKIVNNYDVTVKSHKNLILDGTATSDSIVMGRNIIGIGGAFASLAEGAELGVNFVNPINTAFVPIVEDDLTDGYHRIIWDDPSNVPQEVTLTVLGTDNETVVVDDWKVEVKGGEPLPTPTGLTWYNGDTAVSEHITDVTSYVGKWSDNTTFTNMVSADNRKTWTFCEKLDAITKGETTDIELLTGYVFDTTYIIPVESGVVVDGNGFTSKVKPGSVRYFMNCPENSTSVKTFKNFNFDGTGWTNINGDTGIIVLNPNTGTWVFDNCKFSNCVGTGNAGVFRPTGALTLVLKDVVFENCSGAQGSIRTGSSGANGPTIKLAGATSITGDYNRIFINNYGAIAVSGDFTGAVDVYGNGISWTTEDRAVASNNYLANATVAKGAKITGKIKNMNDSTGSLFAYDNGGVLCWGKEGAVAKVNCVFDFKDGIAAIEDGKYDVGTVLPIPAKADFTGETPKFYGADWYYDNEDGEPTVTTTVLAGVNNYYVGEWDEEKSLVEAYVDQDNYGLLTNVVGAAVNGDTVEIIKDVSLDKVVSIRSSVTVDGNGHTLTYAVDENGKAINRDHMFIINGGLKVLITDVVMDGGGEAGVWGQAIQAAGKGFVYTGVASRTDDNYGVTYNNCTFKGLRVYHVNNYSSAIFVNGMRTTFTGDTLITDNMFRAAQYDLSGGSEVFGTDANGNYIDADTTNCLDSSGATVEVPTAKLGAVIRCDSDTALYIKDNFRSYDNYGIYVTVGEGGSREDTRVNSCEITTGASYKRVVIGPLAQTADITLNTAHGYMVAVDGDGNPYKIGGQVKNTSGACYSYIVSAHNPNAADVNKDKEFHTSVGGDVLPYCKIISGILFDNKSSVGGNLASDKLVLDVYLTIRADLDATLKVTVGGNQISNKTLAEYGLPISRNLSADDTYGWYKVPLELGMAQLTDTIKFELFDEEGTSKGSFTTSAKAYIDTLLAMDTFNTTAVSVEALKNALVSLLEYGTMAQIQFNYNTDKLANDGDYSAYTYYKVAEKTLTFSDASQVKATKSGTLAGVTLVGSSLVLENQVSMRIYVTVDDASLYTFKVDGDPYELQIGKNGSYIEVANIGTAKLAEFVTLTIAPVAGGDGITYTVSPMSYVYTVNQSESMAQSLKDVCEGMFYYFDAVMNAYGIGHGITFSTEIVMDVEEDKPNSYSIPYGIAG